MFNEQNELEELRQRLNEMLNRQNRAVQREVSLNLQDMIDALVEQLGFLQELQKQGITTLTKEELGQRMVENLKNQGSKSLDR
jgi:uncharacterized protein YihD (DUF1040 family)